MPVLRNGGREFHHWERINLSKVLWDFFRDIKTELRHLIFVSTQQGLEGEYQVGDSNEEIEQE